MLMSKIDLIFNVCTIWTEGWNLLREKRIKPLWNLRDWETYGFNDYKLLFNFIRIIHYDSRILNIYNTSVTIYGH